MKKTLVLGASENIERYSNKAIKKLLDYNHKVVAIGAKNGNVNGVAIVTDTPFFENLNTVTLYINPQIQKKYYDYIISLKPQRVIFNPGTENEEFKNLLQKNSIEAVEACTLVMLSVGNY